MKENLCLYCYTELDNGESGFHSLCSKKMFGSSVPPELPYSESDMLKLGEEVIRSQKSVTGFQAKISLGLEKIKGKDLPDRLTIVGLWGSYILKPPSDRYQSLPENEDLTMHLAEIAGIPTVQHSLIRLKSGALGYITRREDRINGDKLHMEDMCQLTERLTEHKYKGSYEQIAKVILKYSATPILDAINFYELVLFSFLTGNSDMHLKNFSLLSTPEREYKLCPAYDLLSTELVLNDNEELALTLNAKKQKIKRKDFEIAMAGASIDEKAIQNVFDKFARVIPEWHNFIEISFLSADQKQAYHDLLESREARLELV